MQQQLAELAEQVQLLNKKTASGPTSGEATSERVQEKPVRRRVTAQGQALRMSGAGNAPSALFMKEQPKTDDEMPELEMPEPEMGAVLPIIGMYANELKKKPIIIAYA